MRCLDKRKCKEVIMLQDRWGDTCDEYGVFEEYDPLNEVSEWGGYWSRPNDLWGIALVRREDGEGVKRTIRGTMCALNNFQGKGSWGCLLDLLLQCQGRVGAEPTAMQTLLPHGLLERMGGEVKSVPTLQAGSYLRKWRFFGVNAMIIMHCLSNYIHWLLLITLFLYFYYNF